MPAVSKVIHAQAQKRFIFQHRTGLPSRSEKVTIQTTVRMKTYFLTVIIFACICSTAQHNQGDEIETRDNDLTSSLQQARNKSISEMKEYCSSCLPMCFSLSPLQESKTACESQKMTLSCTKGRALKILSALYGRNDTKTCQSGPNMTTGCSSLASLSAAKCRCQNKRSCALKAVNTIFGDPCPGTSKYLNVVYQCSPVGQLRRSLLQRCKECQGTKMEVCRIFISRRRFWATFYRRELDLDEEPVYELLKDEITSDQSQTK